MYPQQPPGFPNASPFPPGDPYPSGAPPFPGQDPSPYPPTGAAGYPPAGAGGYPPTGAGGYPPTGAGGYPPIGAGGYPPTGAPPAGPIVPASPYPSGGANAPSPFPASGPPPPPQGHDHRGGAGGGGQLSKYRHQDHVVDDLDRNVMHYRERIRPGRRIFAENLYNAFAPTRRFMVMVVRFPLHSKINSDDGSINFSYSWHSILGVTFFVTSFLMIVLLCLLFLNIVCTLLNIPTRKPTYQFEDENGEPITKKRSILRIEELFLLRRNLVPLLIILLALIHIIVGDISLFRRRKFIAYYFTFWTESVELMRIDAAKGVREFINKTTTFYVCFLLTFFGLTAISFAPVSSGAPAVFGIMWIRLVYPNIHTIKNFRYLRYVATIAFAYIVICSKTYILLFMYKCKILRNAFITWNQRCEGVLQKRNQGDRINQHERRTGFDHLFKDHSNLLELLDGCDTLFTNVIESYYGTQIISVCFEIYYFYRSQFSNNPLEFSGARKLDSIIIGAWVFHSLLMMFLTSTAAAEVGEHAMNGLEIVRQKGNLDHKSHDEMYFMLSLYYSFAGHFETALSGGRYFVLDRGFLVAICGSIFSYVIIVVQFSPPLAFVDQTRLAFVKTKELLGHIENTVEYFRLLPVGYDEWVPYDLEGNMSYPFGIDVLI